MKPQYIKYVIFSLVMILCFLRLRAENPSVFYNTTDSLSAESSTDENTLSALEKPVDKFANLTVFPNPFINKITISHNFENVNNIRILNIVGNEIKKIECQGNFKTMEIELTNLDFGIYFIRLQKDDEIYVTKKIIKKK